MEIRANRYNRERGKEKDDRKEKRKQLRKLMAERSKRRGRRLLSLGLSPFSPFYILSSLSKIIAEEEEATEDIEEIDLRNADFMLSHNIQELMDSTSRYALFFLVILFGLCIDIENFLIFVIDRTLTVYEINLIKTILCAGLYPNVAVSDEFNSSHKESEQVYLSL